jgi:hypothetical protein
MPSVYDLLSGGKPERTKIMQATVSMPAPAGFNDRLYVTASWNDQVSIPVTGWVACNGGTLPEPGAACLVILDDSNQWYVVWWAGTYTTP